MAAARRISRGCFGRRPALTPSWIIAWMRGLAAMSAPRCARGRDISRSFVPDSGLACTEYLLCHTVLRAVRETAAQPRRRFLQPTAPEDAAPEERKIPSAGPGKAGRVRALLKWRLPCPRVGPRFIVEVRLPAVPAETLAMFCTSRILHSRGAASRSFTQPAPLRLWSWRRQIPAGRTAPRSGAVFLVDFDSGQQSTE